MGWTCSRSGAMCFVALLALGPGILDPLSRVHTGNMSPGLTARADPEVDAVVRRMAEYVAGYDGTAKMFIALERYEQAGTVYSTFLRSSRIGSQEELQRAVLAEVAFVRSPDGAEWTGYRDVLRIDGDQVAERRDRLEALLRGPVESREEMARIVAEQCARGHVARRAHPESADGRALLLPSVTRVEVRVQGARYEDGGKHQGGRSRFHRGCSADARHDT